MAVVIQCFKLIECLLSLTVVGPRKNIILYVDLFCCRKLVLHIMFPLYVSGWLKLDTLFCFIVIDAPSKSSLGSKWRLIVI